MRQSRAPHWEFGYTLWLYIVCCNQFLILHHLSLDQPNTYSPPSRCIFKKKGLKTAWNSKRKFEEEVDTTNVCFMANENIPKVFSEPSLENCDLTMEELGKKFEEVSKKYDFLKNKYLKRKKENEFLQN